MFLKLFHIKTDLIGTQYQPLMDIDVSQSFQLYPCSTNQSLITYTPVPQTNPWSLTYIPVPQSNSWSPTYTPLPQTNPWCHLLIPLFHKPIPGLLLVPMFYKPISGLPILPLFHKPIPDLRFRSYLLYPNIQIAPFSKIDVYPSSSRYPMFFIALQSRVSLHSKKRQIMDNQRVCYIWQCGCRTTETPLSYLCQKFPANAHTTKCKRPFTNLNSATLNSQDLL